MDLQNIIVTYGYAAILVGTFLEGETILVLGGFAAHRGYLALPWVILAAFIGSLCGDQLYFYLGRRHSRFVLEHRPSWQPQIAKAQRLLDRFHTPLILCFRFVYGLRTVAPSVIGMSRVPARRFILLNATGAAVWAVTFGLGDFLFGDALEIFLTDLKKFEYLALIGLTIAGLLIWSLYFYRRKKSDSLQSFKTHKKPPDRHERIYNPLRPNGLFATAYGNLHEIHITQNFRSRSQYHSFRSGDLAAARRATGLSSR